MSKRATDNSGEPAAKKAKSGFALDAAKVEKAVFEKWDTSIVQEISDYIKVPNQSPAYDPDWATNGLQEKVVDMMVAWVKKQDVKGLTIEVVTETGRTPIIFIEIAAAGVNNGSALLYGHLDKQPPLTEDWDEGLHPHKPVIKDGKLYGRGGADDGYAIYCAITAIKQLQDQGIPHPRYVVIVEACEESGSNDLPHYCDVMAGRIGTPDLIVCLDSGALNYDQFWLTTSLRGALICNLDVKIVSEGVHSGAASGIVPDSFRIARMLISRLEDEATGEIKDARFHCEIPPARQEQAKAAMAVVGDKVHNEFPFVAGAGPISKDNVELYLNNTWRPALSITGADGLPDLTGGNVLRPHTSIRLSLRLPPNTDASTAKAAIEDLLLKDPPYGAKVEISKLFTMGGWEAPKEAPWLIDAVQKASRTFYKKDAQFLGEGGSIPFMGMLGAKFPEAQFVITGVLGPKSNAHGPNEFLHIDFAKRLNCCVASILASHAEHLA